LDALRAGVTTLRRVGEINRADIALKRMINEGWVEGPRIVAGGYPRLYDGRGSPRYR
jgi:imidazolonepropionase-like amidohydrolase